MSYEKAMQERESKPSGHPMAIIFCTLNDNERRRLPWLGSEWFELQEWETEEMKAAQRQKFREEWQQETQRLLKENPSLKIIE
jgi:hypothetical protein